VGFEYDAYTASDLVGADSVDRFRLSQGEILYVFKKPK
jgi:hypothetical protein